MDVIRTLYQEVTKFHINQIWILQGAELDEENSCFTKHSLTNTIICCLLLNKEQGMARSQDVTAIWNFTIFLLCNILQSWLCSRAFKGMFAFRKSKKLLFFFQMGPLSFSSSMTFSDLQPWRLHFLSFHSSLRPCKLAIAILTGVAAE